MQVLLRIYVLLFNINLFRQNLVRPIKSLFKIFKSIFLLLGQQTLALVIMIARDC